jgi:hypothetical protein
MIAYWAVPYLVVAAPPAVLLLAILLGGCSTTRAPDDLSTDAKFYSDPNSRAGEELINELDRRAARAELRRMIDAAGQ